MGAVRLEKVLQVGLLGHTLEAELHEDLLVIRYDGQEHAVDLSSVPPEGLPPTIGPLPEGAFLGAEWDGEDIIVRVLSWEKGEEE